MAAPERPSVKGDAERNALEQIVPLHSYDRSRCGAFRDRPPHGKATAKMNVSSPTGARSPPASAWSRCRRIHREPAK